MRGYGMRGYGMRGYGMRGYGMRGYGMRGYAKKNAGERIPCVSCITTELTTAALYAAKASSSAAITAASE